MSPLCIILFSVLLLLVSGSGCPYRQNKKCETLNFDDIVLPKLYDQLPRPYHNFIIERNDPSYTDQSVGMLDTSVNGIGVFSNTAKSSPNVLLTSGESISIRHNDNLLFDVVDIQLMHVLLSFDVRIEWDIGTDNYNYVDVSLPRGIMTHVVIKQVNIRNLLICCSNMTLETCGHMVIDDLQVCTI